MKKIILLLFLSLISTTCFAMEVGENNKNGGELRSNFKIVSLDFSNTSVTNSQEYLTSPITALGANDQRVIIAIFDYALEYEREIQRWDNKIFATYGETTVTDNSTGVKTKSKIADKILFTSDYTLKLWRYDGLDLGPFASIEYQTEFKRKPNAPLNRIIRARAGIRLLNNKYFDDLYITNVYEYDFTYEKALSKYAIEVGLNLNYWIREGVDFRIEGYARKYLAYNYFVWDDLEYDINFKSRLDVVVYKLLNVSPFISYRQAKSRGAISRGNNTTIGISLLFKNIFIL